MDRKQNLVYEALLFFPMGHVIMIRKIMKRTDTIHALATKDYFKFRQGNSDVQFNS